MREKLGPWLPALFCGALALIVTIGNVWAAALGASDSAATVVFIVNMPLCFFFVGIYLTKLTRDNLELLDRINTMEQPTASKS